MSCPKGGKEMIRRSAERYIRAVRGELTGLGRCRPGVRAQSTVIRAEDRGRVRDTSLTLETDVLVPMADGVRLSAQVLRPTAPGRHPTILMRTQYGKSINGVQGAGYLDPIELARAGWVVVSQDCRGTGQLGRALPAVPRRGRRWRGHDRVASRIRNGATAQS